MAGEEKAKLDYLDLLKKIHDMLKELMEAARTMEIVAVELAMQGRTALAYTLLQQATRIREVASKFGLVG